MISKGDLSYAILNPRSALKYGVRKAKKGTRTKWTQLRRNGTNILDRDWDNLILLDGCRCDAFREVNTIKGDYRCIRSNASSSQEFFYANFNKKTLDDVVYYSANTSVDSQSVEFHELYRLWESHWDSDTMTVLPSDVAEFVLETEKYYRNKRVIIHFMQPHMPFLVADGGAIKRHPVAGNFASKPHRETIGENVEVEDPWWERLKRGEITFNETWDAYLSTLEVSLSYVAHIVDQIPGKTVISADHGNAFGENGVFGHPSFVYEDVVIKVPWHVIDGERKNIVGGGDTTQTDRSHVDEEKLKALGYLQ